MCDGVLEPLLSRVLSATGDGTALLYGQTGAGKTHTMSSLLDRVAMRLDELHQHAAATAPARVKGEAAAEVEETEAAAASDVEVMFFEVASRGCMDLLNSRSKVALRSDEHDVVHGARRKSLHAVRLCGGLPRG